MIFHRWTPKGTVLAPIQLNKWLVLFCDEINLPDQDKYGTQRVISFLREIVEHGGFYRTSDRVWIKLERVQFVGACNPPTDPGRKPLSHRYKSGYLTFELLMTTLFFNKHVNFWRIFRTFVSRITKQVQWYKRF